MPADQLKFWRFRSENRVSEAKSGNITASSPNGTIASKALCYRYITGYAGLRF
jgi:hypothetical protein